MSSEKTVLLSKGDTEFILTAAIVLVRLGHVLAGVVVFIGTSALMDLPNDLIGYFESEEEFVSLKE
ncbi:hypothetical protein [Lacunimicrobium album]